jgi:hypothetical protein
MGAENYDIVARVSSAPGTSSTGALAAYMQQACGHVLVDERVVQQGYRFHPELGDEIPAFFNKRMTTGSTNVALTLQGGFDPEQSAPMLLQQGARWAVDPFADCRTTNDARDVITSKEYHASLWLAKITVGVQMLDIRDVADPIFIAKHPNEFRLIAEELVSLGVLQAHCCPMCSD